MARNATATLLIGNLGVQIEGPAAWIEALRRMWPGWMDAAAPGTWSMSLTAGPPAPGARPLFEARPHFKDGIGHLLAPGFTGWIDPAQGKAHLEAHRGANAGDLSIFVRTSLALQAFAQRGILFHAAGVVRRGQGYAFFGLSGSGKTTATYNSPDSVVLNDDLILVRPGASGWEMWATPFGENRSPGQDTAPLRALFRLIQAPRDRIERLSPGSALGELVANSPVVNAHAACLPDLMARWQAVLNDVPVRALHFRKSSTFWEVIDGEFG